MSVIRYNGGPIEDGDLVLRFTANWCGPCRQFAPVFDKVMSERLEKALIIDVDQHPSLAAQYDIMTIPTLVMERDGEVLDVLHGAQPESILIERLDEVFG